MQSMMEMIEEQQRHNAISAMDKTNKHPPNNYRLFTLSKDWHDQRCDFGTIKISTTMITLMVYQ